MRWQLVYSVVIFSHRFLDSDCINFKTFAFLAVYWPFWTSKFKKKLNRSSTMLNKVFKVCLILNWSLSLCSGFSIERPALFYLANLCDGDARSALNSLEMVLDVAKDVSSSKEDGAPKVLKSHVITSEHIKDSMQRSHITYDKAGMCSLELLNRLTIR